MPTLAPEAHYQPAEATHIVDGDTIDVEIEGKTYRLRYTGMDTPERGRPFYSEATEANRQLVENQTVYLEKDVSETDRYDRLLRYVYLQDGTMVNAALVCQGFAQVATFPPDVKYQETFLQLQREAREAGRGLWGE
jgi:micrococcal nuclease